MADVLTVRVYRHDITTAERDLCGRLEALAELEVHRLRTRMQGQERGAITTALVDGLAQVTAGTVNEEDLPQAAAAVERGEALAITLIPMSPAGPVTTADH